MRRYKCQVILVSVKATASRLGRCSAIAKSGCILWKNGSNGYCIQQDGSSLCILISYAMLQPHLQTVCSELGLLRRVALIGVCVDKLRRDGYEAADSYGKAMIASRAEA